MLYLTIFAKNLKQQTLYRSEFLLSTVGALVSLYVQIAIWQALLAQGAAGSPLGLQAMTAYVIMAYLMRRASEVHFSEVFAQKVNRGDIAIDLIRPVSLKKMLMSEQLSHNVSMIVFACLPVTVIAHMIWGIDVGTSPQMLSLFALSAALAIALLFYLEYIFGLFVFWVRNENYARQILRGLTTIFSGAFVPLWFYPQWLRRIGEFLPFSLMAFEPLQIFLATVSAQEGVVIVLRQLGWLLGLWLVERLVWHRIKANVFVQGG